MTIQPPKTDVSVALARVLDLHHDALKSKANWAKLAGLPKTTGVDVFTGANATIDTLAKLAGAAGMSLAAMLRHGDPVPSGAPMGGEGLPISVAAAETGDLQGEPSHLVLELPAGARQRLRAMADEKVLGETESEVARHLLIQTLVRTTRPPFNRPVQRED